jgi:hypothetical protein
MDAATLYRDDIVSWAEQQAAALRELAVRPGLSNAVDWANLIEEVECLGRSEWKGVAAQIRNALMHVLKGYCDPDSLSRFKWAAETGNSLREARGDFGNSMRPSIDMDEIWRKAFGYATDALTPYGVVIPPRIPEQCPFALDEILDESFTYDSAVRRLYDRLADDSPNMKDDR